jgi:hypothetical protein
MMQTSMSANDPKRTFDLHYSAAGELTQPGYVSSTRHSVPSTSSSFVASLRVARNIFTIRYGSFQPTTPFFSTGPWGRFLLGCCSRATAFHHSEQI